MDLSSKKRRLSDGKDHNDTRPSPTNRIPSSSRTSVVSTNLPPPPRPQPQPQPQLPSLLKQQQQQEQQLPFQANTPVYNGIGRRPGAYTMDDIPPFVTYTSPAPTTMHTGVARASALPLQLIAKIVAHLDDIRDIAHLTRTSRLLYYMTLPLLYARVRLQSHAELRYIDGRPEGFGGGSPFMMALNGLVTKEHVRLVQEFEIAGDWNEVGVEEFGLGRVPDSTMMLNSLLRVAIDRMDRLEAFTWSLNCKPLKTLYQGLAGKSTLTSLTLRFPTSKVPRPAVVVPPLPNLKAFKAYDIDPLCYPDDIGLMLLHSRNLLDLRLHFSPRMRRAAEPTTAIEAYFGRCVVAGYRVRCKHFAIQNFFGPNNVGIGSCFDPDTCESATFFDTFGGTLGSAKTKFIDDTWAMLDSTDKITFKTLRCNEIAPQHVNLIARGSGLEKIYFVNNQEVFPYNSPVAALSEGNTGPNSNGLAFPSPTPSNDRDSVATLGKDYIYALTRHHGSTLKHMLLKQHWALSVEDIGDIVRFCPNIEQLGVALNLGSDGESLMKILIQFLPKLRCFRILENDWLAEKKRTLGRQGILDNMSYDLFRMSNISVKYVGLGDSIYEVKDGEMPLYRNGGTEIGKEVVETDLAAVQHIEIWSMDCLDLDADPIAT